MGHSRESVGVVGSVAGAVCGGLALAIFHGRASFDKSNLALPISRILLGIIPTASLVASNALSEKLRERDMISYDTEPKLMWASSVLIGAGVAAVSAVFMRRHSLPISYAESAGNFMLSFAGSVAVIMSTDRFFK